MVNNFLRYHGTSGDYYLPKSWDLPKSWGLLGGHCYLEIMALKFSGLRPPLNL